MPDISAIVAALRSRLPPELQSPIVAIVCGSGLSGLPDRFTNAISVQYADIPGFPVSTVQGHKSMLVFGRLDGVPAVAQAGRFHAYEGFDLGLVTLPMKVFHALGCKTAISESRQWRGCR